MSRVFHALVAHELLERLRDRWVIVVTFLFVLLASGVTLYGQSADDAAAAVTAPSIVTLASLLVPLVALILGHDAIVGERERHTLALLLSLPIDRGGVILAKYLGRGLALALSVGLGLGVAMALLAPGQRHVLGALVIPTLLLGATFLSLGVFISTLVTRHATAASLAVVTWFLLVFFYDLGILAALVISDGAIEGLRVGALVIANPTGLYRASLLLGLEGAGGAANGLGASAIALPGSVVRFTIWAAWIVIPLLLGALVLNRRRAF